MTKFSQLATNCQINKVEIDRLKQQHSQRIDLARQNLQEMELYNSTLLKALNRFLALHIAESADFLTKKGIEDYETKLKINLYMRGFTMVLIFGWIDFWYFTIWNIYLQHPIDLEIYGGHVFLAVLICIIPQAANEVVAVKIEPKQQNDLLLDLALKLKEKNKNS